MPKKLFVRVSKTGYMKGWGTRWIGGLSPVERRLVREGHLVIVTHGVPNIKGLPPYRVAKFYGRYGYCPRVINPKYRKIADKAIRLARRLDRALLGWRGQQVCSVESQAIPF